MKIAIYGQLYTPKTKAAFEKLLNYFERKIATLFVEEEFYTKLSKDCLSTLKKAKVKPFTTLDSSWDLLVSIGGDGSFLRAVTFVQNFNIPIIGINTGRLGFLANISEDNIAEAMNKITSGDYKLSERTLITAEYENSDATELNFALNEIAVSRKNTTSMISIETFIDGEYLNSYWADGLIVATPTGSTGYSLSCGGPVIMPESNSFVLTPIAPHNLNARPLIISNFKKITLKISGRETAFLMSLDSRIKSIDNSITICIQKAPFKIKMIELKNNNFLKTLRKKLLWGKDKRN